MQHLSEKRISRHSSFCLSFVPRPTVQTQTKNAKYKRIHYTEGGNMYKNKQGAYMYSLWYSFKLQINNMSHIEHDKCSEVVLGLIIHISIVLFCHQSDCGREEAVEKTCSAVSQLVLEMFVSWAESELGGVSLWWFLLLFSDSAAQT